MKGTLKIVATLAVGVAVVGGMSLGPSAPVSAQAQAQQGKGPTVSRAAAKPLKAAQDALNGKKWQEALTHLKEVEALSNKTPYDVHAMNELAAFAHVQLRNYGEAARAMEAGLNSGFLAQSDVPTRVRQVSTLYYQAKNYDKAIEYGNRAVQGGFANEDTYTLVGQAYYIKGDFQGARRFLENYIEADIKRGQTPKEQLLQLVLNACLKLEDKECQTRSFERLVAYHPKPEYWQNVLISLQNSSNFDDKSMLHLYRLRSEVGALTRPEDYTEMAQLAIEQGSPGEAQRILELAFQKNVFTDQRVRDRNQRLLEAAKKEAAADRASLAQIEKDAAASKTGDKDIGVAIAYLGYEQYDKAVELLNRGLSKGGVRNEAEARLLLGIAQYEAGKRDEALKSFSSVKGDANLERLANLWRLHARQA